MSGGHDTLVKVPGDGCAKKESAPTKAALMIVVG